MLLNPDTNTITVRTTSEDGKTTKTYTVTIIRRTNSNAWLVNLTASSLAGGSGVSYPLSPALDFNSKVSDYSITVADNEIIYG